MVSPLETLCLMFTKVVHELFTTSSVLIFDGPGTKSTQLNVYRMTSKGSKTTKLKNRVRRSINNCTYYNGSSYQHFSHSKGIYNRIHCASFDNISKRKHKHLIRSTEKPTKGFTHKDNFVKAACLSSHIGFIQVLDGNDLFDIQMNTDGLKPSRPSLAIGWYKVPWHVSSTTFIPPKSDKRLVFKSDISQSVKVAHSFYKYTNHLWINLDKFEFHGPDSVMDSSETVCQYGGFSIRMFICLPSFPSVKGLSPFTGISWCFCNYSIS